MGEAGLQEQWGDRRVRACAAAAPANQLAAHTSRTLSVLSLLPLTNRRLSADQATCRESIQGRARLQPPAKHACLAAARAPP